MSIAFHVFRTVRKARQKRLWKANCQAEKKQGRV